MIGIGLIVLGFLGIWLAVSQWRDYRESMNDFAPLDAEELHPHWARVFKIQRIGAHFDIWVFGIVGLASVIGGIVALLD